MVVLYDLKVSAVCSSLQDNNILVQRSILDVILQLFSFKSLSIKEVLLIRIITTALQCLLKRDQSIIRRVIMWLLGKTANTQRDSDTDSSSDESVYFITYTKPHLLSALRQLMTDSSCSTDKSLLTQPYRVMRVLYDQSEMMSIFHEIIPDLLSCLSSQINQFGGIQSSTRIDAVPQKIGKRHQLKADLLYSANQFWMTLEHDFLWGWIKDYLSSCLKTSFGENDLDKRIELVLFLLKILPLVSYLTLLL